ncbi:MAG: hypothetical protein N2690_13030, partial [Rhodocyclaceae bacterium]|nr:hypothetical protein [Rhodocyclaceae bacterium]
LYERGFTISGARNQLQDGAHGANGAAPKLPAARSMGESTAAGPAGHAGSKPVMASVPAARFGLVTTSDLKAELRSIRDTLLQW